MESPPDGFTAEQVSSDENFLENVQSHVLDSEKFVAGSFQSSHAAWQELLKESKKQTS